VSARSPSWDSPRGTLYAYTPLAGDVPLRSESVFHTDDPTAPFSFMVIGDSGSGSPEQFAVRDAMLGSVGDFILHVGDMVYNEGLPEDFNPKLFTPYAELLRERVLWPCLGSTYSPLPGWYVTRGRATFSVHERGGVHGWTEHQYESA